jgi:NTP pyrophosphatase (non-canonical NTP hydrolase)
MPAHREIPYGIGSDLRPGYAKLSEECGELVQMVGKIMAYPDGEHPDGKGNLDERFQDELADVSAAIEYVILSNKIKKGRFDKRKKMKLERFARWHEREQGKKL